MKTLTTRPCRCGGTMRQVIYAERKTRRGWYCPNCKAFERAIGRERTWEALNGK